MACPGHPLFFLIFSIWFVFLGEPSGRGSAVISGLWLVGKKKDAKVSQICLASGVVQSGVLFWVMRIQRFMGDMGYDCMR